MMSSQKPVACTLAICLELSNMAVVEIALKNEWVSTKVKDYHLGSNDHEGHLMVIIMPPNDEHNDDHEGYLVMIMKVI